MMLGVHRLKEVDRVVQLTAPYASRSTQQTKEPEALSAMRGIYQTSLKIRDLYHPMRIVNQFQIDSSFRSAPDRFNGPPDVKRYTPIGPIAPPIGCGPSICGTDVTRAAPVARPPW